jgi:hypothetical protein
VRFKKYLESTLIMSAHKIRETATLRWFSTDEIYEILTNYDSLGLEMCIRPPFDIKGNIFWIYIYSNAILKYIYVDGTLWLVDRLVVPNYKSDGIEWAKKKGTTKLREEYVKLTKDERHIITGLYTCSATDGVSPNHAM